MEIPQIKSRLTLKEILHHYNLHPKNGMLLCPFHEDKNASLQVNLEKNFYKCHACGKSGDVIQFVQDYEKLTKHQALKKCTSMIAPGQELKLPRVTEPGTQTPERTVFLQKMFLSFRKGLFSSIPAKEYCQSRSLDFESLEIGFNSGQFHHGQRKDEKLINDCLQYGLLALGGTNSRTGGQAYKPFGNKGIVFPLKNKENEIVSFYYRSTINDKDQKHYYLKNRQGLYPGYPNPDTKKLILTEAIVDTASLLQIDEINQNYTLLTCYGTNGLTDEILNAVKPLKQLEEIIFFFDGDKAGNEAVEKYTGILRELQPNTTISKVETPQGEDINSLIIGHESEILTHLINERKEIEFSFSIENQVKEKAEGETHNPKRITQNSTIDFLQQENLLQNLNNLIEQSGIIGEENSRLLLLIIASSYKTKSPLHAIVQGSSGSGKTHLIGKIADLVPQERCTKIYKNNRKQFIQLGRIRISK